MSGLLDFYPGDAWAILVGNVLVQVTVVTLAARLLARLGGRWGAAWRHHVYLVALVCVLASPVLAWSLEAGGIALWTFRPRAEHTRLSAPPAETVQGPAARIPQFRSGRQTTWGLSQFSHGENGTIPFQHQAGPEDVEAATQGRSLGSVSAISLADTLRAFGMAAFVAWLVGMVLLLARWCHGLYTVARLRRSAQPLDAEAMGNLLGEVRRALGTKRLPPLATSAELDRPLMVGLVRPLVILPRSVLGILGGPKLRDVLVHECAHAVCRHQVVGLLQRLAATLFWPHPLVHRLNRELARAREEVCDNYVLRVGDAPRYARTLLELSQLLASVSPKPAALGLFHPRWRLEDRIAGLLDGRRWYESNLRAVSSGEVDFLGVDRSQAGCVC